jgi:hypothetical protein
MILYHFAFLRTSDPRGGFMRWEADNLKEMTPAPEGLTPAPGNGTGWGECEIPGAPEVVWLTTSPLTVPAENSHIFRITAKIPATDRKLINWPRWVDRHLPRWYDAMPLLRQLTRNWWGYAGTIALSALPISSGCSTSKCRGLHGMAKTRGQRCVVGCKRRKPRREMSVRKIAVANQVICAAFKRGISQTQSARAIGVSYERIQHGGSHKVRVRERRHRGSGWARV